MEIDAFPMRLVALTDGVFGGREHVVLFLRPAGEGPPRGFALPLDDARLLRAWLVEKNPAVLEAAEDVHVATTLQVQAGGGVAGGDEE